MGAPLSVAPGEGADDEGGRLSPPAGGHRLTAAMSSRKLQAHDFIKRYFARWGQSPTIGEIAAELRVARQRAHGIVRQLSVEKMIEVVAGKPRGIRLIDRSEELSEVDVLLRLVADGWAIAAGEKTIVAPPGGHVGQLRDRLAQLTRTGLSELLELDHVPEPDQGDGDGDQ
jgi:DNA-binding IscR family transcriptional regulator